MDAQLRLERSLSLEIEIGFRVLVLSNLFFSGDKLTMLETAIFSPLDHSIYFDETMKLKKNLNENLTHSNLL